MTREEAIKVLEKTVDNSVEMTMREWEEFDKLMVEAVDMAIEALKAEPTDTDLISRADAINAFWEDSDIRTAEVRATLKALPSARPDLISRAKLFNKLATVQAPPEANEYKAEVYKIIQSMGTEENDDK